MQIIVYGAQLFILGNVFVLPHAFAVHMAFLTMLNWLLSIGSDYIVFVKKLASYKIKNNFLYIVRKS